MNRSIRQSHPVRLAALVLCGLLASCSDQEQEVAEARATGDMGAVMRAEDRQSALYDQADSLWALEAARQQAAVRADNAGGQAADHSLDAPMVAARAAGDYSFTPPPPLPVSRTGQLLNLPAPGATPRFVVTDRVWPATAGALGISMWHWDKLAAFSLTIDDNHVQDHAFWYEMAAQYGWKWTWFVIANQVGWSSSDHWGHWQQALDRGHDVQNHSYSHLCDALFYTQREYRQSSVVMEQNLAGARVQTMAYPFGFTSNKVGSPCEPLTSERTKNSRAEAAKQFLAVRDVYGALTHPGKIDYLNVPSISSARNFLNPAAPWAYFDSVLNPTNGNFRAWYVVHYHNLPTDTYKQEVRQVLAHLKTREDQVWVGKFADVARYAQEYASAQLVNVQVAGNQVSFGLQDSMYDAWFDHPLTVKLRLPTGWAGTGVSVTQAGVARASRIVMNAGQPYALLDVVPDRGVVTVVW